MRRREEIERENSEGKRDKERKREKKKKGREREERCSKEDVIRIYSKHFFLGWSQWFVGQNDLRTLRVNLMLSFLLFLSLLISFSLLSWVFFLFSVEISLLSGAGFQLIAILGERGRVGDNQQWSDWWFLKSFLFSSLSLSLSVFILFSLSPSLSLSLSLEILSCEGERKVQERKRRIKVTLGSLDDLPKKVLKTSSKV